MARLRSAARQHAANRQAELERPQMPPMLEALQSNTVMVERTTRPSTPQRSASPNLPIPQQANHGDVLNVDNVVAAIGMDPPLGSQSELLTPPTRPPSPSYTWKRTSPVNRRASGLFVLHLGATPQTSPMSRAPPNVIVNRQELKEALRGNPSRSRRGQGGVRRRLDEAQEDPTPHNPRKRRPRGGQARPRIGREKGQLDGADVSKAPDGWHAPRIFITQRSPISLRPRFARLAVAPLEEEILLRWVQTIEPPSSSSLAPPPQQVLHEDASNDEELFIPGTSPPDGLLQNPVHSPSEHCVLDNEAFPENMAVKVQSETLDLDPGLVGDENGVSGLIVSRFYHHVIGTPMFSVDFGGTIGTRSVRVSDNTIDLTFSFEDSQRTLFVDSQDNQQVATEKTIMVEEERSNNDPDWHGAYEDFLSQEASGDSTSDGRAPSYTEDPLKELGFYNYEEDVSTWPFDKVFTDDQWQDQSITLAQNTNNFSGPEPGPTSAVANHPSDYFLRYWPPQILQHVVDETNRYATQPSEMNPAVTNGRAEWTPLDSEELLAWFGVLMFMGLKEFPHIRCYWDRKPFYNCPLISEAMPRKRFEAIIQCLHLVDNNTVVIDQQHAAYDKLAKVRWLCESFSTMSQRLYNNERALTVDEITIAYKGRFCNIRQHMKSKPVKFGVKV